MKERTLIAAMFGLLTGMLITQSGSFLAHADQAAACQESKTIFRDASRISRKNNAAVNMTKKHDEYTSDGWRFVDMEIYNENSDMEGFFLTYSRDIACTPERAD